MPMAATVTSLTGHATPLGPGPGCPTVLIGGLPAWRAMPAALGSAIEAISNLMNSFMLKPQTTPVDATPELVQISQKLVEGGTAAAGLGAPLATGTAISSVAALNVTNAALSATWLTASVAPGGQPAANIAYTEGIKAAAAAASTAVMASMAGLSDMHICPIPVPIPPHGPGFVTVGSATVVIGGLSAARQGDLVYEACGGPDPIAMGCPTVMIGDSGGGPGGGGPGGASGVVAKPSLLSRLIAWVQGVAGQGPTADEKKLDDIKALLRKCPTGRDAVKFMDDQKIPVVFADGGGSYWDGTKIVIDRSQSTQDAALTVVHELHHARSDKSGTSGNTSTQTRADYVKTMVEEESIGTVKSIQAKNELAASGEDVSGASFPLEDKYNEAYAKGAADYKTAHPDATPEDVDAAGSKAGLNRVRDGFNNGEVITSTKDPTTGAQNTYPQYYGNAWDDAHK